MTATKPKVVNMHNGPYPEAVRVDRRTKWGNPYVISRGHSRAAVVEMFKSYIQADAQAQLRESLSELRGKDLACWCTPLPCHADVLLELANR